MFTSIFKFIRPSLTYAHLRDNFKWFAISGGSFCSALWFHEEIATLLVVEGGSMRPTINPDTSEDLISKSDACILWKLNYKPQRGDVICLWPPRKAKGAAVKRIVALEGDSIVPRDRWQQYQMKLKHPELFGTPLVQSNDKGSSQQTKNPNFDLKEMSVTVPVGHVWVEGDNGSFSMDSNTYGPVPVGMIIGKVTRICIPQDLKQTGRIFSKLKPQEIEPSRIFVNNQLKNGKIEHSE